MHRPLAGREALSRTPEQRTELWIQVPLGAASSPASAALGLVLRCSPHSPRFSLPRPSNTDLRWRNGVVIFLGRRVGSPFSLAISPCTFVCGDRGRAPPNTALWQNTEARAPRGGPMRAASSANFPPFSSARTNCLKSLFMYSRLGKLGYVSRKFFPVSDLKSEQRCSWWSLRCCQCILSTLIFRKEHELSVLNLSLLGLLCTHGGTGNLDLL